LISLLPEEGQSSSPSLSALNSLASLLSQKSNPGLSLEQLSALTSLVRLLQAKTNGAPASTYGPPHTEGAEMSPVASLVKLVPPEKASSPGSLVARLQSLLRRRPNFLKTLLNALNLVRPWENKGASLRFVSPSTNYPLPIRKVRSTFDSKHNTVDKFIKNIPESKVVTTDKFQKNVVLGEFVPKTRKLGKLAVIKSFIPINTDTTIKGSTLSKLGKLGKLGIISGKLPLKFGIISKSGILKSSPSLGKHFPLKVHLSKFKGLKEHSISPLGKKHLPLKAAIVAAPLKVKKHLVSKVGTFGKIIKPVKLSILGKLSALKSHLLSELAKLVKTGVVAISHTPLKLLRKYAAIKKHFASKLIKLSAGAKHVKHGTLVAPIAAKKHSISKLKTLAKVAKSVKTALPSKLHTLTGLKGHLISKLKTDSKFGVIKHPKLKFGLLKEPAGHKRIIGLNAAKFGFTSLRKSETTSNSEISRKDGQIENGEKFGNNDDHILNGIPNSFLGTNPDADVPNLLVLPDLPPITLPANYKFQETGVEHPYVVKYSKSVPSALRNTAYIRPTRDPLPSYGAPAQRQQEGPLYNPVHVSSKYAPPTEPSTGFGPQKETSLFQLSQSNSQQAFTSFQTPTVSYQSSVQEPRNVINSYGQPTAQYRVLPTETGHTNSNFQTQPQNPSYDNAAQTSVTDTSASRLAYSVSQQNHIQPEVAGTSVQTGTYQFAQSASYPHHSYPSSRSDLPPGTSRSDTNIPSDDVPSKQDDDFRPSTLAAATGSGYSRVTFQRSRQETPQDIGLANQKEGELDFVTTSTSDVSQSNGDLQDASAPVFHVPSTTSSEDSELRKQSVYSPDSNKFRAGNR
jgi:hypothetical protein